MMLKQPTLAIIIIALSSLSNWVNADNVYKCGDSYSQVPCPGGTVLDVSDPRDAAQKKQADEATIRDARLAKSMTQERLAQEKLTKQAQLSTTSGHPKDPTRDITEKSKKSAHPSKSTNRKPKDFIAEVPGSKKVPATNKASNKKNTTSSN